jgi:hypothetical protein
MKETNDSSSPPSAPPTPLALSLSWSTLVYYVIGSSFFIAGALGFLLSIYLVENWLVPFQFGAITWIIGCIAYMIPLIGMFKFCSGSFVCWPWGLGEIGYVICLLCFIVGCGIVFFGPNGLADEEQVLKFLPAMNGLFVGGSACLLLNPIYHLLSGKAKPWMCKSPSSGTVVTTVDWWFEMAVAFSFTFAGAAGGYGNHPKHITAGLFFWIVGSVILFVQAMYLIVVRYKTQGTKNSDENPKTLKDKRSTLMMDDDAEPEDATEEDATEDYCA